MDGKTVSELEKLNEKMERASVSMDNEPRPSSKDIGPIGKVEAQLTPEKSRDTRANKDSTETMDNDDVLVDEAFASDKLQIVQEKQRSRSVIDSGGLNDSDSENEYAYDYFTLAGADEVDAAIANNPTINSDDSVTVTTISRDATCYNMNHKKRGRCEVFNHKHFRDYPVRTGTEIDAKRIKNTFEKLGFDVNINDDYTHGEITNKLEELKNEDYRDHDCLCIFVMTHGLTGDVICAKDASYKMHYIWKEFIGNSCKTLIGKPKLFFFQACRGNMTDPGVGLRCNSGVTETDSDVAYRLPTHADFLIANSTVEGFYTWRNPSHGTWYIQTLCDVIDKWAPTTDLLRMLTITARKVATKYESDNPHEPEKHNKKQIPSLTSMLIRDVYFYAQAKETDL